MGHIAEERKIESFQIRKRLQEIEGTIYDQRQPLTKLSVVVTGTGKGPEQPPTSGWRPLRVNQRWGGFDQTTWFRVGITVPASMAGRRVVAFIRPGAESLAYLNGKPCQGLDNNRDEIYLTEKAKGGETFELLLEAVPSVRDDIHHTFEYADIAVMRPDVWDFWWDCTTVIDVWEQLPDNYAPRLRLMNLLSEAVRSVDLQRKGSPAYFDSISHARRILRNGLKEFSGDPGVGTLAIVGHSHIDTAWLWPIRETRRKCGRTFSTVLNLLERYPDFRFTASQPVLYEFVKTHYPSVYRRIKAQVRAGRWEVIGGMWAESDCNVPSGESFVRQLIHGNRFFRKEFGVHTRTAWLPDTFGLSWQLPQILRKAQIDTVVTTKIEWGNEFTKFPYNYFQWEGADGSRIRCLMPPPDYNGVMTVAQAIQRWDWFKQKDRVDEVPYPVGHGDGGGGPTMAMIERARRLDDRVGVPKCVFSRAQDAIDRMARQCPDDALPVYNDELYLECHRGCQTAQGRTKRNNRDCETLLHDAEFLNALALRHGGRYDQNTLDQAWKILLTNQFHDILPGSSITEVYTQADKDYAEAKDLIAAARDKALAHLSKAVDTAGEGTPVLVCNSLSWVRSEVVRLRGAIPKGAFTVRTPAGEPVPHQRVGRNEVLFEARELPPMGYAVYRLVPGRETADPSDGLKASAHSMENGLLRIRFDKRGRLTSIYDKQARRETIPKGERGNVLQLFDDRCAYSDAWDIDHNFADIMWEPHAPESIEVIEEGPLRAVVRIVRKTDKSTITQDVTMYADCPRVDFITHVDWWEKRTLLKAAFPVDVRSSRATYEIQFAAIERPTHDNTAHDRGRFENTGHRWADLSEGDYGVSLLNNCKYGYDIKGNTLRLSLLRSTVNPDPHADEGEHDFTYSIYPHEWAWRNGSVQQGYELNTPVIAEVVPPGTGSAPGVGAFASVDADHVILSAVKKCEDSQALIVRLYEAYGQRGDVRLTLAEKPKKVTECDLMEENDRPVKRSGCTVRFAVKPFEIRTFKVEF